jgi:hypothetical protein
VILDLVDAVTQKRDATIAELTARIARLESTQSAPGCAWCWCWQDCVTHVTIVVFAPTMTEEEPLEQTDGNTSTATTDTDTEPAPGDTTTIETNNTSMNTQPDAESDYARNDDVVASDSHAVVDVVAAATAVDDDTSFLRPMPKVIKSKLGGARRAGECVRSLCVRM